MGTAGAFHAVLLGLRVLLYIFVKMIFAEIEVLKNTSWTVIAENFSSITLNPWPWPLGGPPRRAPPLEVKWP
jgi:hypothetical protein